MDEAKPLWSVKLCIEVGAKNVIVIVYGTTYSGKYLQNHVQDNHYERASQRPSFQGWSSTAITNLQGQVSNRQLDRLVKVIILK